MLGPLLAAVESELGIDRRLARIQALVGGDLYIGTRVGADGSEGAIGDIIVRDLHAIGAVDIDAVAIFTRSAGIGADA